MWPADDRARTPTRDPFRLSVGSRGSVMSALADQWGDDGLPVAVVRTDMELRATFTNDAWHELAGTSRVFAGKDWTSLFDPDDRSLVLAWLSRFARTHQAERIEVRGRSAGEWFELRAAPGD